MPARASGEPSALGALQAFARRTSTQIAALVLVLGFFATCAGMAARTHTPTPDEFVYVPAGLYHLSTGDLSFDPTNPPLLKMLMAAPLLGMDLKLDLDPSARDNRQGWGPWVFGTSFMDLNRERYVDAFFAARLVIIAIGVLLGVLVFVRARETLSPLAALATLVLYGTMAPLIAHTSLATLDMGVTALVFAALLAAARLAATKEWGWAVLCGALLGFAFVVKGTAALFAPLVPLLLALGWRDWSRAGTAGFVLAGVSMAAAAWVAILGSYGFSGFPLPAPLIEGLRFQIAASSGGEYPAYLFGQWSAKGWWYYYLVALVLKTPLPSLLLFGAGAVAVACSWMGGRHRRGRRAVGHHSRNRTNDSWFGDAWLNDLWLNDLWIVLPPLLLIYLLSFHYAKDYGIRYLLPAFPFLVLLAGRGVDLLLAQGKRAQIVVAALLVWQTAACAVTTPHHLSYFNELVGGPERARHLLLDSNLDWGQDLGRLKDYLLEHPAEHSAGQPAGVVGLGYFGHVDPKIYGIDYAMAPVTPTPGRYAISANFLAGYPYAITYLGGPVRGVKAGAWSWLERLHPTAMVGRSIYVYDVSAEDVARLSTGASTPAWAGQN